MSTVTLTYERKGIDSCQIEVPCRTNADLAGIMQTIDKHFATKPPMDPVRWAEIVKRSAPK